MPLRTRRHGARLAFVALLVAALTLACAATLQAQVLSDPRVAEFDPSPDHSTVLDNGQPAVLRYELNVYLVGASAPFATVDMGKPSPDPDGKIRYDFSAHVAAWPLPGGDYDARVSAIGPEGAALSDPSNPFTFTTNSTCSFSLSAASISAPASGGSYAVDVSTGTGCTWTVTTALTWVTIGTNTGSGNGRVFFSVQANSSTSSRAGAISIGGQTLNVSQAGATSSCSFSLSPGSASVSPAGGNTGFTVTANVGCAWTAATANSWIAVAGGSGSGTGAVSLAVDVNSSAAARTGTVTVQGRTFTVTQAGAGPTCSYDVSPTYISLPASGGSSGVSVVTDSGCAWGVVSGQSWLMPSVTGGTGSATVTFTVSPNNGRAGRTAQLTVGPWTVWVSESGRLRKTK